MQVGRPLGDDFRRFRESRESRVAIAPVSNIGATYQHPMAKLVPVQEIRLDVLQNCSVCGVPVRQGTAKMVSKLLCQGCRPSELQRQKSLEDIRPASPMTSKTKTLTPVKSDGRVHPSWTVEAEIEQETDHLQPISTFRVKEDAGFFASMEVLTCFRSEVRRGLRLLSKAATAEKWHMCWALLFSMCLMPLVLTLMLVAGVGFLVLSTWVVSAAVVVYPLTYINPRLYNYAMDS